jgi:hypothetical protein
VTDEHLSIDELAELDEGLLTPELESEARAHLAACGQCRTTLEAIVATRSMLAELPDEPMPEDVRARLDKALADAAPRSASVVPSLDAHRAKRFGRPTMAASAAAAAIVLLVGGILVAHARSGNGSSGEEAAGTGVIPQAAASVPAQPKNYVRSSTGLNYSPANLGTYVPGLVAGAEGPDFGAATTNAPSQAVPSNTPGPNALDARPVPAALKPLFDSRKKLLHCAASLSGIPNAVPIAVDFGTWTNAQYKAAPSAIFVLRDPESDRVDVYVTDPTCSGVGQVRTFQKVPLN